MCFSERDLCIFSGKKFSAKDPSLDAMTLTIVSRVPIAVPMTGPDHLPNLRCGVLVLVPDERFSTPTS